MEIQTNYSLAKLTTFRIGGEASYFAKAVNMDDLNDALDFAHGKSLPVLIMGGGSNMLVSDEGFKGLVLEIDFKGFQKVFQDDKTIEIKVGAGEIWDEFVEYAVKNNFWGIENLSGIPGKTGAVPVQNVGAYGQDVNKVITKIEVLGIESRENLILTNEESKFGYRSSQFNTEWKNKYAILSVNFSLNKEPSPNLGYVDLKKYFADHPDEKLDLPNIRRAILEIRKNKFPDLAKMGTAGSFFKNLILDDKKYDVLEQNVKKNFGEAATARLLEIKDRFPQQNGIKIPAAFLIDICGLKGKSIGEAKLWEKQPVIVVNSGNAKASDVVELYEFVRKEVLEKTSMELVHEPEFIGF